MTKKRHYPLKAARHIAAGLLIAFMAIHIAVAQATSPWEQMAASKIENSGGNDGTSAATPILIKDAAELAYLAQQVNARGDIILTNPTGTGPNTAISPTDQGGEGFSAYFFALSADIDLQAGNWTPIGNTTKYFGGHFDGKGHTVKGLAIKMHNTADSYTYAGLFGYVYNGTLQNIGVELADEGIEVSAKQGYVYAGGITGRIDAWNNGTAILRHCYVTGKGAIKISGAGKNANAGGITGYAFLLNSGNLTVTHCYATIDVEATATESSYAGGIAGSAGKLSYCFATGNVEAKGGSYNYAGGICGSGSPSNCLALNKSIEGNKIRSSRIMGLGTSPSNNYASSLTKVNGAPLFNQSDPSSKYGADTWLETFKEDLQKAPSSDNGWKDDSWEWPTAPSTLLPKLKVITDASGTISYDTWPGQPAQPNIDAAAKTGTAGYLNTHAVLHIVQPAHGILTVTYESDPQTPLKEGDFIGSGSTLTLSYTATTDGYSRDKFLVGDSRDYMNQEITDGTLLVLGQGECWLTATETYTAPTPPTPVLPPYIPVYYTVTLPQVDGATTDPVPGQYDVESWDTFRFYLTLDTAYSASAPLVTTSRGETLKPRQSDGAYLVKYVRTDVEIFIDSIRPNHPVANEPIASAAQRPKAWTADGLLHLQSPLAATAYIYTPDGRQAALRPLAPGQTESLRMPAGVYFVRIGEERFKVIL